MCHLIEDSALLQVKSISKVFDGVTALLNVSFEITTGEIVGLLGHNGSGKTTLLNVISRICQPDKGTLLFGGRELLRFPAQDLIYLGITRLFQIPKLCGALSVFDNVLLGAQSRSGNRWNPFFGGDKVLNVAVLKILDALELSHVRHLFPSQISLFDRRKTEIARAWMAQPRFVLIDEVSSGLAITEKRVLLSILRRAFVGQASVLLVEHDIGFVRELCDRIIVLHAGQKIAEESLSTVESDLEIQNLLVGAFHADAK